MNIDDKLKRLEQLKKIDYPSDQEYQEIEKLEEEIQTITNKVIKSSTETKNTIPEPPKKGSLLRKILRVTPKEPLKPVTQTELDQLTMEAKKQEILSRIAKAKAEQNKAKSSGPSIFDSITKVIGKSNNNPFDVSASRSSKKRSVYDPFRW